MKCILILQIENDVPVNQFIDLPKEDWIIFLLRYYALLHGGVLDELEEAMETICADQAKFNQVLFSHDTMDQIHPLATKRFYDLLEEIGFDSEPFTLPISAFDNLMFCDDGEQYHESSAPYGYIAIIFYEV